MSYQAITMVQGTFAPSSTAVQYTQPAASKGIVRHAVFTNITGSPATLTIYIVESGGSVTDARKILDAYSINAHTAYTSPELSGVVLNAGDVIETLAGTGSAIAQNISGILQT